VLHELTEPLSETKDPNRLIAGAATLDPSTAESLRLLRATQARPIQYALGRARTQPQASPRPTSTPPRRIRPRR
jgi:hypothetical protein